MIPFPLLGAGARVALVAPAGPIRYPADLNRATKNALTFGWEPVLGEHARSRAGYLAGTDADRLADLNAAFRADSIDAVWCLRGGYGAMRLLDGIDYAAITRRPKAIIGYSDVTALHCAVGVRCGVASLHGPTARSTIPPFAEQSLRLAVMGDADCCGVAPVGLTLVSGRAKGRLLGGNLALLVALHGTPFEPDYDGAILILEDVNEASYRIERMLLQLRLSGALQRCAGLVFGSFTNTGEERKDRRLGGNRSVGDVLTEAALAVGIPAIAAAPIGHIDEQWSVPLGFNAELDADEKRLTILPT